MGLIGLLRRRRNDPPTRGENPDNSERRDCVADAMSKDDRRNDDGSAREWEATQQELRDTMRVLQENARDLTRSTREFQERYIDDCELHCVRCLIELYRHLDGLHRSHAEAISGSENVRYVQAVEAFAALTRQVERDLSSFGVEIYRTAPGESYDPNLHIPDDAGKVSPDMVIAESLRPGFRSDHFGERLMDEREMVHLSSSSDAGGIKEG